MGVSSFNSSISSVGFSYNTGKASNNIEKLNVNLKNTSKFQYDRQVSSQINDNLKVDNSNSGIYYVLNELKESGCDFLSGYQSVGQELINLSNGEFDSNKSVMYWLGAGVSFVGMLGSALKKENSKSLLDDVSAGLDELNTSLVEGYNSAKGWVIDTYNDLNSKAQEFNNWVSDKFVSAVIWAEVEAYNVYSLIKETAASVVDYFSSYFHDGKFEIDNLPCDEKTKDALRKLEGRSKELEGQIEDKEADYKALTKQLDDVINGRNPGATVDPNVNSEMAESLQKEVNILSKEIEELKSEKSIIDSLLYNTKISLLKKPYEDLAKSEDFKKFSEDYKNGKINPNNWLANIEKKVNDGVYDISKVEATASKTTAGQGQQVHEELVTYKYMSEDQRIMYHYLYETEGKESADSYLKVIQDDINKAAGTDKAEKFLSELDYDDEEQLKKKLAKYLKVSVKGLGDGIDSFYNGLNNAIITNEVLSADQYESMVILQTLAEKSKGLDNAYEISSSMGNMAVPMAASAIVSYFATPAAGEKVASVLMGVSAYGNALQQSLAQGYSTAQSVTYAFTVGTSEAVTGYFLGAIPGIGKEAGLSLKSLLKEGGQELIQEFMDAGCRAAILGEDIDLEQLGKDGIKSFVYGVLVAGILNGGQKVVSITINGSQYDVDVEQLQEAIEKNPDMTQEELLQLMKDSEISFDSLNALIGENFNDYEVAYDYVVKNFTVEQFLDLMLENGLISQTDADDILAGKLFAKSKETFTKDEAILRALVYSSLLTEEYQGLSVEELYKKYNLSDTVKDGTLSFQAARAWYLHHDALIESEWQAEVKNGSKPDTKQEKAKFCFEKRNEYREKTRDLMKDREMAKYLNEAETNYTWEEMMDHKINGKHLSEEAAYDDIIDSSKETRATVNKVLSIIL